MMEISEIVVVTVFAFLAMLLIIMLIVIVFTIVKDSEILVLLDKMLPKKFKHPHEIYPEIPFWEEDDKIEYGRYSTGYFKDVDEKGVVTLGDYLRDSKLYQISIRELKQRKALNSSLLQRQLKANIKHGDNNYRQFLKDYKIAYVQAHKI